MDTTNAAAIIATLEEVCPRMTSDGYKPMFALKLTFVEKGALGQGVHARYQTGRGSITVCGIEEMSEAVAMDTLTHEHAHAVLDMAFHQCPQFRRTAGHCSHFVAMHKTVSRVYAQA